MYLINAASLFDLTVDLAKKVFRCGILGEIAIDLFVLRLISVCKMAIIENTVKSIFVHYIEGSGNDVFAPFGRILIVVMVIHITVGKQLILRGMELGAVIGIAMLKIAAGYIGNNFNAVIMTESDEFLHSFLIDSVELVSSV